MPATYAIQKSPFFWNLSSNLQWSLVFLFANLLHSSLFLESLSLAYIEVHLYLHIQLHLFFGAYLRHIWGIFSNNCTYMNNKFSKTNKNVYNCLIQLKIKGDPGSPAIVAVYGTSRGVFFEQHFILSSGFECKHPTMLYTRISSRQVTFSV